MIYLNNAATTFPKPRGVNEAVRHSLSLPPESPERGGATLAREHSTATCRHHLTRLLGTTDPSDIVLTAHATLALNIAIRGLLPPSGHVVTTAAEHNSVLRPLYHLHDEKGIRITIVPCDRQGIVPMDRIENSLQDDTVLVVLNHCSNVTGAVQDAPAAAELCRRRGVRLLLDLSQSAGNIPLALERWGVDMAALTGHKSLYGIPGCGALYLSPEIDLPPLYTGGTGIRSDCLRQPKGRPIYYEAGTRNTVGIHALSAATAFVLNTGVSALYAHKQSLCRRLREGLQSLPAVRLYGPEDTAVVSFTIDGIDPTETAHILAESFSIIVRGGLHCAPLIHESIGSAPRGTARASPSYFNTPDDITALLEAVQTITGHCP